MVAIGEVKEILSQEARNALNVSHTDLHHRGRTKLDVRLGGMETEE